MGKFTLAPVVEDELWAIWQHIAEDNPDAATRVVQATHETFRLLAANPALGPYRKFKNSRLKGVRSFLVTGFKNYLVFY